MRTIIIISALFVLYSCEDIYNQEDEAAWSEWAYEAAPLSDKEKKFIDSLANIKSSINITRTFIGRAGHKSLYYDIHFYWDDLIMTPSTLDSIGIVTDRTMNELYSNVISDSVLCDMTSIYLAYTVFESPKNDVSFSSSGSYSIDTLEQWNGFKVIKVGKNKYKRVLIKPRKGVSTEQ